jgi:hypothetical protein
MKKSVGPQTIEITRKLDLTGLGEEAADKLRKKFYAGDALDPILQRVIGQDPDLRTDMIIIYWHRWLQFVQSIGYAAAAGQQNVPGPIVTEEITTHHRIDPGS